VAAIAIAIDKEIRRNRREKKDKMEMREHGEGGLRLRVPAR